MRPVPVIFGVLTLALAWLDLFPKAQGAFFAHMAVHMSVVAVAAPLLAIGLAGGSFDPVRRAPALFSPILASLLELAIVWLWHTPLLHHAARNQLSAFAAEQSAFLLSGFTLWISVLGGEPPARAGRRAEGIVALLLTAMHMTLLGALFALSPRPFYAHGPHSGDLSPLDDQHLGGVIMLIAGGVSYLAGGLWLAKGLLGDRQSAMQTRPRQLRQPSDPARQYLH
ncbi:MAG TPA: cytochrome c oxidase assembly protein [Bryobacteraceae bacterium]|nr:cytochrome c oxidase assembly protein [Bryobacteraceae bacterium]